MRNLHILLNVKYSIPAADLIICGKPQEQGSMEVTSMFTITNNILYHVNLDSDLVKELYNFEIHFPSENSPKAVSMWFRDLYDSLYICFDTGEIITLVLDENQETIVSFQSHTLGFNLIQIDWSPDEELAVAVSTDNNVILLNRSFESLYEIDIQDTLAGENELINVGWGKKETQFHGSEGKKAALAKPINVDSSDNDDRSLKTVWRDDSNLFAVGYWSKERNKRLIKIFNNDGILQCTSEEIQGLGEALGWRPQGNLISFPQQLPNKQVLAFMEKNGLKHGDFLLPNNLKVYNLYWSESSSILCTSCKNKDTGKEEILLWTTGNYHWYLKQKFTLKHNSKKIWWDKERVHRLYILEDEGILHVLEWTFSVDANFNTPLDSEPAYVAVIDGSDILLTAFNEAIIPPPMYSYKLTCPEQVNRVLFATNLIRGKLIICAVLCNNNIALFSELETNPAVIPSILKADDLVKGFLPSAHYEWLGEDLIVCLAVKHETFLYHLTIEETSTSLKNTVSFSGTVITLTKTGKKVIIQTSKGKLLNYGIESLEIGNENITLPEPCVDVKIDKNNIYCLSEWSRLYVNGSQISLNSVSGNITSFLIRTPYLLLTTSSHRLFILCSEKHSEVTNRKIERGSKIVSTHANSVILQIPRGNLEVIQPRAFTILSIIHLLNSKHYKKAMTLMRKQRIDLNLVVDFHQAEFVTNASTFVDEVDPEFITLLITELSDGDVTKTSYSDYFKSSADDCTLNGDKVKTVCNALLCFMTANNETIKKFIFPILSALVKTGQMEKAIKLANSEQALQHLMFIVDTNKLFSEALGAYDLEAALKIAEKSRKDPKEYIPYLNSLKAMEPNYMKYTIDKSLNRLGSALGHLSKCSDEYKEECYNFVKNNSLYSEAVNVFKGDSERFQYFACMYGEYLFKEKRYEESGIMYMRGQDSEKAVQSFTRAGNWRQCMIIALKENYSDDKLCVIADDVSRTLVSSHNYHDAAQVYLEWLSNPDKAMEMYILGGLWREAMYIAEKYKKPEFLGSIRESLLEAVDGIIENIIGNTDKMTKYVERLKVVRVQKLNRPMFIHDDFSDTSSDTSSTSSRRTRSSRASRSTKKMIKKFWNLKEGNPREEEALIATLSQIIESSEKFVGEVNKSCSSLLLFGEDKVAATLQNALKKWIDVIEKSKNIIWPKDPEATEQTILDDKYKHPPEINIAKGWEFDILNGVK